MSKNLKVGQGHIFFWVPAALGAVCAALAVAAVPGMAGMAGAGALLAAGGFLGWWLAFARQREIEEWRRMAAVEPAAPANELMVRAARIWSRQLDSCRSTGDESVAELTRNFSDMVERLNATLSASSSASATLGAGDASVVNSIRRSENELAGVLETLKEVMRSRAGIIAKVGDYAAGLKEMAGGVQQIALQIRLLSLNGAIEASRAGEAGKAFGVVAGEMRKLAGQSAELGTRISKEALVVNATVAELLAEGEGAAEGGRDTVSIERAERDIEAVLGRFKGLTGSLQRSVEVMERESAVLKQRIADALVAFQFQDRVSQIVSHVRDGLARLDTTIGHGGEDLADVESWIEEMARGYSAEEEFDNLRGTPSAKRAAHDVQFF
jgi:methyl-accepting chemotaxis protein